MCYGPPVILVLSKEIIYFLFMILAELRHGYDADSGRGVSVFDVKSMCTFATDEEVSAMVFVIHYMSI